MNIDEWRVLWLLETVVEHRLPVFWPFQDDAEVVLNFPTKLPIVELRSVFEDCIRQGLVEVLAGGTRLAGPDASDVVRHTRPGNRDRTYTYGLSTGGQLLWERWSSPSWNRFAKVWSDGEVEAASTDALAFIFASVPSGGRTIQGGHRFDATYWRSIPNGVRGYIRLEEVSRSAKPVWRAHPLWTS